MRPRRTLLAGFLVVSVVGLAMLVALGVSVGSAPLPLGEVWRILGARVLQLPIEQDWTDTREAIVMGSRLPRSILAAVVGAMLALCGAVSQRVTRNPLADPYLLGVSSGASFGVMLVMVFGISAVAGALALPVAAFIGTLLPILACLVIVGRSRNPVALILMGVAMAQLFTAGVTFALMAFANDQEVSDVVRWTVGGLGAASWTTTILPSVVLVVVGAVFVAIAPRLDLLYSGDDAATAMGMNVPRFRALTLLGVSFIAAISVSVAGPIGFIGLVIPHAVSFFTGLLGRRLIPACIMGGALALVGADIVARTLLPGQELPVGVITGAIGAPIFIVLLWRHYRRAT